MSERCLDCRALLEHKAQLERVVEDIREILDPSNIRCISERDGFHAARKLVLGVLEVLEGEK